LEGGGMKNLLDKTVTLRQIFICCVSVFALAVPVYIFLFFQSGWRLKMGGAPAMTSPYYALIPDTCKKHLNIVNMGYRSEIGIDALLLRGRFKREILSDPFKNFGEPSSITCLGYSVIGALHEGEIGVANFTQQFQDKAGNPIVTVRVEYHQAHPYPPTNLINELKASQK
jgi:hypothetical protein